MEVVREILGVGVGVDLKKAIDPLTPSETKVGLLALDESGSQKVQRECEKL